MLTEEAITLLSTPSNLRQGDCIFVDTYVPMDIQRIAEAICKANHLPQDCKLSIRTYDGKINDIGGEAIATILRNAEHLPNGFRLNLISCQMSDKGAHAIATALGTAENLPKGFSLDLSKMMISAEGIQAFAAALILAEHLPQGFKLDFSNQALEGTKKVQAIAVALRTAKCLPHDFSLSLWNNNINDENAKAIADALSTAENLPQGFSLRLDTNNIGAAGIQAISTALSTAKHLPQGFKLHLESNDFGPAGAKTLAALITAENLPTGFHLGISQNNIGNAGLQEIVTALCAAKNLPTGFRLNLSENDIGDAAAKPLTDLLTAENLPIGFHLNIRGNNIGNKALRAIATALCAAKQLPQDFYLGLEGCNLTADESDAIATTLSTAKNLPIGFHLDISRNNIGKEGIQRIADALCADDHHLPRYFSLNIEYTDFGTEITEKCTAIKQILQNYRNLPEGFTLQINKITTSAPGFIICADTHNTNQPSSTTLPYQIEPRKGLSAAPSVLQISPRRLIAPFSRIDSSILERQAAFKRHFNRALFTLYAIKLRHDALHQTTIVSDSESSLLVFSNIEPQLIPIICRSVIEAFLRNPKCKPTAAEEKEATAPLEALQQQAIRLR
jgi:hypothetical protein